MLATVLFITCDDGFTYNIFSLSQYFPQVAVLFECVWSFGGRYALCVRSFNE